MGGGDVGGRGREWKRWETGWCVKYIKKNGVVIKTHRSLYEILYFIFMPKLSAQRNEFHPGD